MSNTYSINIQTLSKVATRVLTSRLAPLAKMATILPLDDNELRGPTSQAPINTVAPATQSGSGTSFVPTYESGDCTVTNVQTAMTLYAQCFGVSGPDAFGGLRLEHLLELNLATLANKIADDIWVNFTTANYGAAVVTTDSGTFTNTDLDTLMQGVPSAQRCVVLDSGYWQKVKPTWLPIGFNEVHEHSRWGTAGTKVHGLCADPRALVIRYGIPISARAASIGGRSRMEQIEQDIVELPQIGIIVESSLWLTLATRSVRASYCVYLGSGVGDTAACKLLCSNT